MKAIQPVFDRSRTEPYYMQLYQYLRDAITSGDIGEGERMPSLRALARSTGLSVTTVEKAYEQLLVEGYIYSRPQSGYYAGRVSWDGKLVSQKRGELHVSSESSGTPAWLFDPDCFDFNKWKKCMNRILTDYSPALFFESSPQGELALRTEIARYLFQSRGVSCSPDQILIGAGTQQITGHLANILRELQVEHIALEDPAYTPVRTTFRDRGFAITSVAVAQDGLVLEKLPANIRAAAYVTPSNHSFTGAVMPIGRRYELIRWAIANDSFIIEDDYDSELRYFGRPIPALKSLTGDDRVIYLGSFSSTLFAAVRISYMVLPPQIAHRFTPRLESYSQTCSKLEQLTLAMFMETGMFQTHLRKLRKLYAQKLARLTQILQEEASDFLRLHCTSSGITILLEPALDRIHKRPAQLKEDAEFLGIPLTVSGNLLVLYYNQIPLAQIPDRIRHLIRLWRS